MTTPAPTPGRRAAPSRLWIGAALVAIVAVAAVLRGIGVQYGLPDVYNPDEINVRTPVTMSPTARTKIADQNGHRPRSRCSV